MNSLVIIKNGAADTDIATLQSAIGNKYSVTLIADENAGAELLATLGKLQDASTIINGKYAANQSLIDALNSAASIEPAGILTYSISDSGNLINLTQVGVADLIELVTAQVQMPLAMIKASAELVKAVTELDSDSAEGIIARFIIKAAAENLEIANGAETLQIAGGNWSLDAAATAKLLSFTVAMGNIEDLFPQHPWESHEEEAAAACFHTLAAHFIRLGDVVSARECLNMSDNLEDSPRSLALKAMISRFQGETLGAVANLVSSLQQYELRKRDSNEKHYLSFAPKDLEVINSNLHQGLSALNKQENEKAFKHFATAVANFDNFYSQLGVDLTQ